MDLKFATLEYNKIKKSLYFMFIQNSIDFACGFNDL